MPKLPKSFKVEYVLSQRQTREHHCHWPGCELQCPPAMWGCKKHWFSLPKYLRDKIWAVYRPGQEVNLTPSQEYLEVAEEVQQWIRDNYWRHTMGPKCIACNDTGINSQGGVCVPCAAHGRLTKPKQTPPLSLGCLFDD